MTEEKFRDRLGKHLAVNYRYSHSGITGLINIWFYENTFVLTWEECKDGDQANEDNYSRDERHEFVNLDLVIGYLQKAGIQIADFAP